MASSRVPQWVARPGNGPRRSSPALAAACLLLAALAIIGLSGAPQARAAEPASAPVRVLLLAIPRELERALSTALSPWGMQVDVHPSASDADGLAASRERASALSRTHSAAALVWLEDTSERRQLWLFDASKGATTSREVPRGPIHPALAAALALSIKTQLRGAAEEVAGGAAQAPSETQARPKPEPAPPAAPPAVVVETRDVVRAEASERHAPSWQFVVLAGLRGGALEPGVTEMRFGAELRWAPELDVVGHLGSPWVGARFDAGPAADVDTSAFQGSFSELGGGLSLGLARRLNHLFSTGLQVSFSFHAASLEGTLLPDTPLAPETRLGSSLQLRPEMGLSLGAIGFVLQPVLGTTLRRQSFIASGRELLDTRPVWWMIGVGASVSVE